jgi:hypothetical protein
VASLPALALLAACGAASDEAEDARCFPVPAGAHLRVATHGMEEQGRDLQGGAAGKETNGVGLQRGSTPPEEEHNGRGAQDAVPEGQDQGTSLQGDGYESEQGTGLQGDGYEPEQGTSLQGDGHDPEQGTSLQGDDPGARGGGGGQGAYRGLGDLNGARGGGGQGGGGQGAYRGLGDLNGARGDGGQGGGGQGAYRGLGDLNGARLALAADASNAVTLRDGQLTARGFADAAALRGVPLTATASDGRTFRVELVAITLAGRTRHYELAVDGLPVCEAGEHGLFVPGRWDGSAAHHDDASAVTYSCNDGVIAKCVTWGYAPWLTSAATHAACTRMARADYCGDGTPWTMDGTVIDIYDRLGVQPQPSGGFAFEAAWGPAGALCVARARYQIDDGDGGTLLPACFATLPTCHSLDEAAALGAELANQSRPTPIAACR